MGQARQAVTIMAAGCTIRAAGSGTANESFWSESKSAMPLPSFAAWMLEQEARALLTRLGHVKPLAMQESMLPAAGLLPESQTAIEQFLTKGRLLLRSLVVRFLT